MSGLIRRCVLRIVVFVVALSLAQAAIAQDTLGIFFDENLSVNSFVTTGNDEIVTMYLTIVSPSTQADIEGFVGTVRFEGDYSGWSATPVGGCSIFWVPPTIYLSCMPPIARSELVIVAEYLVQVPTPNTRIEVLLLLNQVEGPYYVAAGSGDVVPLMPTSGSFNSPVAVINDGAVRTNSSSWGEIKSIFR